MDSDTKFIKAKFESKIKKCTTRNKMMSYDDFRLMIQRLFDSQVNATEEIIIEYLDEDKDWIFLENDDDLSLAMLTTACLYIRIQKNKENFSNRSSVFFKEEIDDSIQKVELVGDSLNVLNLSKSNLFIIFIFLIAIESDNIKKDNVLPLEIKNCEKSFNFDKQKTDINLQNDLISTHDVNLNEKMSQLSHMQFNDKTSHNIHNAPNQSQNQNFDNFNNQQSSSNQPPLNRSFQSSQSHHDAQNYGQSFGIKTPLQSVSQSSQLMRPPSSMSMSHPPSQQQQIGLSHKPQIGMGHPPQSPMGMSHPSQPQMGMSHPPSQPQMGMSHPPPSQMGMSHPPPQPQMGMGYPPQPPQQLQQQQLQQQQLQQQQLHQQHQQQHQQHQQQQQQLQQPGNRFPPPGFPPRS